MSRSVIVSNCVVCHALIPNSDNALLATIDGTIFTFDQVENKVDNQVRAGFIPHSLHCHPDGAIFLAVSEKGLVQCFDIGLTPIQLCFPNEEQVTGSVMDIGLYFRHPVTVRGCGWSVESSKSSSSDISQSVMNFNLFLMRLQTGPLMLLRFNAGVFTQGRIGPIQVSIKKL